MATTSRHGASRWRGGSASMAHRVITWCPIERVVEHHAQFDALSLMQQIGALPA